MIMAISVRAVKEEEEVSKAAITLQAGSIHAIVTSMTMVVAEVDMVVEIGTRRGASAKVAVDSRKIPSRTLRTT